MNSKKNAKERQYFLGMSEQEIKDYKEAEKRIQEEKRQNAVKNQQVLDSVKEMVSKKLFEIIENLIEESEDAYDYRIVDAPTGKRQKTDEGVYIWVDQWSVGDSGDAWSGIEYVPLPNGKFLSWWYEIW